MLQQGGELWGALYPELMNTSSVGCPMYMTPPSLWPEQLAQRYFGNKTVFGVLRDPYERLVAFFRGGEQTASMDYGGNMTQWLSTCDVDSAIRHMMEDYLRSSSADPYAHMCTYVPQSEYFGGPFGIEVAVDNREFPNSANEVF